MAPHDSDWSDSEDEVSAEVETSVLLGVPDGDVEIITDLTDAAVSRIGGHPVRSRLYITIMIMSTYTSEQGFSSIE